MCSVRSLSRLGSGGWVSWQVFASLVVYDMLFWASHVAVHRVPWLYRTVHAKHHRRRTLRARETVALSVADEALDVACSIAALNVLNVHPLSRCAGFPQMVSRTW